VAAALFHHPHLFIFHHFSSHLLLLFAPTTNTSRPIKRFYWRNFNQKSQNSKTILFFKKRKKKQKVNLKGF
jgi:hypothetical protein